jgi:hypothetical protein
MMRLFSLVPTPYMILGVGLFLLASHGFAYFKGYQAAERKQAAAIVEQMKKEQEYLEKIDELSREAAAKQQVVEAKDRIVYRTIIKEIPNATSNSICFNDRAVSLWNDALTGEMPEASTGASTEAAGASATDTEILENAAENFHLYKNCRDRLNALIDWHESVNKIEVE